MAAHQEWDLTRYLTQYLTHYLIHQMWDLTSTADTDLSFPVLFSVMPLCLQLLAKN